MKHIILVLFTLICLTFSISGDNLVVNLTLVQNASATEAYCLDGTLPGYHLDRGSGDGESSWLLQVEGGGWCQDIDSCFERSQSSLGSTKPDLQKDQIFFGILSNNASLNPNFYNWNRVKLRYCDGSSFSGDSIFDNGTMVLHFRGQRIWNAIIQDLLPKGLGQAQKALLSGCSAGGLTSFLHCDNFRSFLNQNATVKCLSDAGFFVDELDISQHYSFRSFYHQIISLHGILPNLNEKCKNLSSNPEQCFFAQYNLPYIQTPLFVLNTAFDFVQIDKILAPFSADPQGKWASCKGNLTLCDIDQYKKIQDFRNDMLSALKYLLVSSAEGGVFINSCYGHCQTENQDLWFAPDSPRINNKTIAEAVGDWYFSRNTTKEIDSPNACYKSCQNFNCSII